MSQITIQIPLGGLILALFLIAAGYVWLIRLLRKNGQESIIEKETELKPFSEPRPFPEPVPPVRIPARPVVPAWNPNIRPVRYAHDQKYFEWFYAGSNGKILKNHVEIGSPVEEGDVLMTVFTGNVEADIRATASGKLREVFGDRGAEFKKADLLYVITL